MNTTWDELTNMNFDKPWIFLATPTLHTDAHGTVPKGGSILEIETFCPYDPLKEAMDKSYAEYNKIKMKIANHMIDIVEKRYIPDLRTHIAVKVVGTPTTNEDFCLAPKGNAYGASLTPRNMGLKRLKANTPWKNFFWCNASSGYPGFYGTVKTGMNLYMQLTGDNCFGVGKAPVTSKKKEQS
jgi:phytoene dehydrogenase-like protein